MDPKILIHVQGGCVTGVFSNQCECGEVEVFDVDNLHENLSDEEIEASWNEKSKGLEEVW